MQLYFSALVYCSTALVSSGFGLLPPANNVHPADRVSLYSATAVTTDAINDLQAELDAEGLGLCHGILHASGVRCLSDLKRLTPGQIVDMGIDNFDRSCLDRVMDMLTFCDDDSALEQQDLSTLVAGAFDQPKLERFDPTPKQDFDMQVICAKNDIFKGRLFTEEQCLQVNRMAEYHNYETMTQSTIGSGWTDQIYTLTAQHMPCKEVPGMMSITKPIFDQLKRELYALFKGRIRPSSIQFENDSEPHLVKYDGKAKGTEMHTDNSEYVYITLNVVLSNDSDFNGGGTYIEAIDETIHLKQGEMIIHLGDLEHAGQDIHSGVRRLLICFLACEWVDEALNIAKSDMSREALAANHAARAQ